MVKKFRIIRQDDNGVRSIVEEYADERAAQEYLRELEEKNKNHKQTYWIEKRENPA